MGAVGNADSAWTSFTIPMRGNEFVCAWAAVGDGWAFTIPMRGNESMQPASRSQATIRFTIPMRGNECSEVTLP